MMMPGRAGVAGQPSIDVVIVNYRTADLAITCLESLVAERREIPSLRAIVVDNESGDGSAARIAAAIEARGWSWATALEAGRNGGFGAGNNVGIAHALAEPDSADLIWMLNPDTRVMPGAAAALVRFMAAHPRAGIAGSALREGDGTLWPYAFRFPNVLGEIERGARWGLTSRLLRKQATARRMEEGTARVDWVSGASFVVRRELLEAGLRFDEDYFLYYEETDLCLQAKRAGWECWYVAEAEVLHIAGQSTGVTGKQAVVRRMPSYWFDSRRRYFVKNHGRFYGMLADAAWIGAHLFDRAKQAVQRSDSADPPRLLADFVHHSALMPRQRRG